MKTIRRSLILKLAALPMALTLMVRALSWAAGPPQVQAHTPHAGLDLSMAVTGASCDTKGLDNTKCTVPPGDPFTVSVSLNAFDEKWDGFGVSLDYAGGITSKETATVVWPG